MSQVTIAKGRRQSTAYCYLDPARAATEPDGRPGGDGRDADPGGQALRRRALFRRRREAGGAGGARGHRLRAARSTRRSCSSSPASARPSACARWASRRCTSCKGVGENLRDHYSPRVKFAITEKNLTFNDNARGWRLAREALKYALFREGFLASTSVPIRLYFRTRPGLETPDATVSIAPFLYEMVGRERRVARKRGHHHERQRAALREHRLDPHQVLRSGRAAGHPLQLPVGRARPRRRAGRHPQGAGADGDVAAQGGHRARRSRRARICRRTTSCSIG